MPLKTWDTKADYDDAYAFGAEGLDGHPSNRRELKLHYHRSVLGNSAQRIADHFTTLLTAANFNRRFVIVGGGFGWVADELIIRGFTNIVVVDTSVYIQAEKDNDDEAEIRTHLVDIGLDPDTGRGSVLLARHKTLGARRGTVVILDEDISTSEGRSAINSAVSGNPQIVVSETVMESLTDAEAIQLDSDMNAFNGNQTIAHLVYTLDGVGRHDPGYNWKTLADWELLIPGATWIDAASGAVL